MQPRTPRSRRAGTWGSGLLVAGFVLGMVGLILLTGGTGDLTDQRDDLASDLREDATTTAALCATGGDVARALDAAGLCGRAVQRLSDPVIVAASDTLTPAQIEAIVARVRALSPRPADVGEIVDAVLADPRLQPNLTEADVRSIIAAVLAQQEPVPGPPGRDGEPGEPGPAGDSFGGLEFVRDDGVCVARSTIIEADGDVRTQDRPVDDAACGGDAVDPPPPVTQPPTQPPDPDPPVVEPEPEPEPEPPAVTQAPDPDPPATQDAPPPDEPDSGLGGLLDGLIG